MQECNLPVIHNWVKVDFSHGSSVFGSVYNDSRYKNGTDIRTSGIVSIDEEAGILKTRNTEYALGKKIS